MRTHILSEDIHKAMVKNGYGGKETTVVFDIDMLFVEKGDKAFIKNLEWCESCDEFHLIIGSKSAS